jgi:F-type H+-transporting ATPase subunit epsilon
MALAEEFDVRIVTPGRAQIEYKVERVHTWAKDGWVEIHPDHASIAYALGQGTSTFKLVDGSDLKVGTFTGIAHFHRNLLEIFSPNIEYAEEVDVDRAKSSLHRARQRLAGRDPQVSKKKLEWQRAIDSRDRAIVRLGLKGINVDE